MRQYANVLNRNQVEQHFQRYVKFEQTDDLIERFPKNIYKGKNFLDLGCGYGSFVLALYDQGYLVEGLDNSSFEISVARNRHNERNKNAGSQHEIFHFMGVENAESLGKKYNVLTAWNFLEHVKNVQLIIAKVETLLTIGGEFHFICPNYSALRKEAHYQIPWIPYLSKKQALRYLKIWGKDPSFFEQNIFPVYKLKLIRLFKKHNFKIEIPKSISMKISCPDAIKTRKVRIIVQVCIKLIGVKQVTSIVKLIYLWPWTKKIDLVARNIRTGPC